MEAPIAGPTQSKDDGAIRVLITLCSVSAPLEMSFMPFIEGGNPHQRFGQRGPLVDLITDLECSLKAVQRCLESGLSSRPTPDLNGILPQIDYCRPS